MAKAGLNRSLWIFDFLQAVAILGFAVLAKTGMNIWTLGWVIGLEAFVVGLGTAAFVAFIAQTTDPRYTATQFALFTSLSAIPRTFLNAITGYLVEHFGWYDFFLVCTALAIPGMLILFKVAPWNGDKKSSRQSNGSVDANIFGAECMATPKAYSAYIYTACNLAFSNYMTLYTGAADELG
ncbi:hypothetical protein ACTFIZ_012344 [Dictyostelium cf. discoideum]